ncbi:MAG: hypothetical protein EZS28_036464, partial [Streblomastix strix]
NFKANYAFVILNAGSDPGTDAQFNYFGKLSSNPTKSYPQASQMEQLEQELSKPEYKKYASQIVKERKMVRERWSRASNVYGNYSRSQTFC